MELDVSKPAGSRVRSLHILCTKCRVPQYEPVEDAAVYTVVVPEYLVSGGDGYAVIGDEMVKHDSGETLGSGCWVLGSGSGWSPGGDASSRFSSFCRRLGRLHRVPVHQPAPAGLSSRGRSDQLLQLRFWTGTEPSAGSAGSPGAALDRLRPCSL